MNETLKNELCQYLGELIYQNENEFDWFLKNKIREKIKAVDKILDIEKQEKTCFEELAM